MCVSSTHPAGTCTSDRQDTILPSDADGAGMVEHGGDLSVDLDKGWRLYDKRRAFELGYLAIILMGALSWSFIIYISVYPYFVTFEDLEMALNCTGAHDTEVIAGAHCPENGLVNNRNSHILQFDSCFSDNVNKELYDVSNGSNYDKLIELFSLVFAILFPSYSLATLQYIKAVLSDWRLNAFSSEWLIPLPSDDAKPSVGRCGQPEGVSCCPSHLETCLCCGSIGNGRYPPPNAGECTRKKYTCCRFSFLFFVMFSNMLAYTMMWVLSNGDPGELCYLWVDDQGISISNNPPCE